MSWLYSQALVEEFLEAHSLDGERCAQLKLSPTPQAYCSSDKMTEYSRISRSGMTYAPLTDDLGEGLLTWYLEVFRARISQRQEKEQVLTEKEVDSGERWPEWFAKYDPNMSLWKTPQCSLLEDYTEYSGIWPKWGTMRNGECSERTMPGHHINETESGYWPTPLKSDATRGPTTPERNAMRLGGVSLQSAAKWWPTPNKRDWKDSGPTQGNRHSPNLGTSVHRATPAGGTLNPDWVEWLMGWPIGWTGLAPLETDKFQQWYERHGMSCASEPQTDPEWNADEIIEQAYKLIREE